MEEKQSFYDELKGDWNMHSVDDIVVYLGDVLDTWVGLLIYLIVFMECMV